MHTIAILCGFVPKTGLWEVQDDSRNPGRENPLREFLVCQLCARICSWSTATPVDDWLTWVSRVIGSLLLHCEIMCRCVSESP